MLTGGVVGHASGDWPSSACESRFMIFTLCEARHGTASMAESPGIVVGASRQVDLLGGAHIVSRRLSDHMRTVDKYSGNNCIASRCSKNIASSCSVIVALMETPIDKLGDIYD